MLVFCQLDINWNARKYNTVLWPFFAPLLVKDRPLFGVVFAIYLLEPDKLFLEEGFLLIGSPC